MRSLEFLATSVLLAAGLSACGADSDVPAVAAPVRDPSIPAWANVQPEQWDVSRAAGVPVAFENGIGMRFVLIPQGTFRMGSPAAEKRRGDDEHAHDVHLTNPYYLSVHETTNAEYRRFKPDHDSGEFSRGDRRPATQVTHDAATAFVAWLNGQDPDHRYALPTQAQWEHACRARTTSPFGTGSTISDQQANYNALYTYGDGPKGAFRQETTDVGSFAANRWNLFDMHGNAEEWCSDRWDVYPTTPMTDPTGPASTRERVVRGGSFMSGPAALRSAERSSSKPTNDGMGTGVRVMATVVRR